MFAVFLSLWSRPRANVTWITDEYEIVANDNRLDDVHQIAARLVSRYAAHKMGIFAMNSTTIDGNDRFLEDFVSISDLSAGMLSEVAAKLSENGKLPAQQMEKDAAAFTEKTTVICRPRNIPKRLSSKEDRTISGDWICRKLGLWHRFSCKFALGIPSNLKL
jgi:hypothetical protein